MIWRQTLSHTLTVSGRIRDWDDAVTFDCSVVFAYGGVDIDQDYMT